MHPGYDYFSLFLLATTSIGVFVWAIDQGGQIGMVAGWVSLVSFTLLFLGARH